MRVQTPTHVVSHLPHHPPAHRNEPSSLDRTPMFRAGTSNVARAIAASGSKKAASTTSAARNAPIRVGINGFGRIGRLVRASSRSRGVLGWGGSH